VQGGKVKGAGDAFRVLHQPLPGLLPLSARVQRLPSDILQRPKIVPHRLRRLPQGFRHNDESMPVDESDPQELRRNITTDHKYVNLKKEDQKEI